MTRGRQPSPIRFRVTAVVGAALISLLLVLTGLELVHEFNSSRTLRTEVNRSYETRLQIERVFSLLQDAETGQRGYIITGDERFLEPYSHAQTELDAQTRRLSDLFDVEAAQAADMSRLQELTARKLHVMAANIQTRQTQGAEAAMADIAVAP